MNFYTVYVALLGFCMVTAYNGNGQPGCKTEEEVEIGIFRANWDPTAFWKCVELNQPAILERCDDGLAFMESRKDCVNWNDWEWELPIAPISKADESEPKLVVSQI